MGSGACYGFGKAREVLRDLKGQCPGSQNLINGACGNDSLHYAIRGYMGATAVSQPASTYWLY